MILKFSQIKHDFAHISNTINIIICSVISHGLYFDIVYVKLVLYCKVGLKLLHSTSMLMTLFISLITATVPTR